MDPNTIKERLSQNYVDTVAARAGMMVFRSDNDYGVDGSFRPVKKFNIKGKTRYRQTNLSIDYQLKASSSKNKWAYDGTGHVTYKLEKKTYDDLVYLNGGHSSNYCLLILLCLPYDEKGWLTQTETGLSIHHCGYWYFIDGKNPPSSTKLRIPRAQQFTSQQLTTFFDTLSQKGTLL